MPITRSQLRKKRGKDIVNIKPISRKYYPVDYRDSLNPVWYNAPFDNLDYGEEGPSVIRWRRQPQWGTGHGVLLCDA